MVTPLSVVNNLLMVGFTVSVLVLCNWKSKIFLFMTSCAAKQIYWYGNWWFQLVVELLWVLSYWDVYLWGIWKELVRNAVNFYLSFNDLQIHFLFKLRIRQNYFKCKLYQGFSTFIFTKKILVHFQDLHRHLHRNNK